MNKCHLNVGILEKKKNFEHWKSHQNEKQNLEYGNEWKEAGAGIKVRFEIRFGNYFLVCF